MDVSNAESELNGQELIQKVIYLTGLPEVLIRAEMDAILKNFGADENGLTLASLRAVLAAHLDSLDRMSRN